MMGIWLKIGIIGTLLSIFGFMLAYAADEDSGFAYTVLAALTLGAAVIGVAGFVVGIWSL